MSISEEFLTKALALPGVQVKRNRDLVSARQEICYGATVILAEEPLAVGTILRLANACRQPMVIMAGNTGLVGAGVPSPDEVVLDLSRLVNVCSVDLADGRSLPLSNARHLEPEARLRVWEAELMSHREEQQLSAENFRGARVTVEAAVTVDGLNALLLPLGIEYPMDMGSNAAATIGGCTANGSAGARALRNGTGATMAARAVGYWANGEPADCPHPHPGIQRIAPGRPLVDSSRFPLGDSLIGSQGTLGVITHAQVLTSPRALGTEVALFPVDTLAQGVALVARARPHFASAESSLELAELIDRKSLLLVEAKESVSIPFDDPAARSMPYFIMLQARADSLSSSAALTDQLLEFVEAESRDASLVFYDSNPGDANLIRKLRHSITHASDARLGELKAAEAKERGLPTDSKDLQTRRVGFDVAVPLAAIDAFAVRWSQDVARDFPELEMHLFGHLGVGGFHIHHRGRMPGATKDRLFAAMATAVTAFGGTISAEHGVGPLWTPLFLAHADDALKRELAALFARRDPLGILSPRSFGKLVRYRVS